MGKRGAASRAESNGPERGGQEQGLASRTAGGIRGAGAKTVDTVKQHPLTTALIGAGVAAGISVLAWRALRGSTGQDRGEEGREGRAMTEHRSEAADDAGEQAEGAYEGEEGGDEGDDAEEGEDEDEPEASGAGEDEQGGRLGPVRAGASRLGQGAQRGYELGKEKLGDFWEEHPLMVGAAILGMGVAAGMLVPATRAERKIFGRSSSNWTNKLRSAGRELLDQGKQMAGKVASEAGAALREEAEKEGLSPDKLARKVKRIAGRIKDAISDATD